VDFDAIFAAHARPTLVNTMGTSVIYRVKDADAVTLTAVVGAVRLDEEEDEYGQRNRRVRSIAMGRSATAEGGGVADVRVDATLDIGDDKWTIEAIEAESETFTRVRAVRTGRVEESRDGYRVK
jgi:hypothetical protein